jgi:HTH-type transcriptional regulator / antitoxin HigA
MEEEQAMSATRTTEPDMRAILAAWRPLRDLLGVGAVRTEADHTRATALIQRIIDEIGEDEAHPLAEVLDLIDDQVAAYESRAAAIPDAPPRDVLRFLMDSHGLTQGDLKDCAPQGRISDILAGRRAPSKAVAKALAKRFGVGVEVFL